MPLLPVNGGGRKLQCSSALSAGAGFAATPLLGSAWRGLGGELLLTLSRDTFGESMPILLLLLVVVVLLVLAVFAHSCSLPSATTATRQLPGSYLWTHTVRA